jgi:hypothetical protein
MPKGIKGFQKGKDNPKFGKIPHNFRKHPSEETIKKLSESHKGYIHTEEQKRKISLANKGKSKPEGFTEKISGEKHHNWKGGKSFQLYGIEWTNLLKHSIRTRDCFVCQICKKNGWVVHHIDYNKKNNNPENLTTLCKSCHAKTNFNREYWIKYFTERIYE